MKLIKIIIIFIFVLNFSQIVYSQSLNNSYTCEYAQHRFYNLEEDQLIKTYKTYYDDFEIRVQNFKIDKGIGTILLLDDDREQYFKFHITRLKKSYKATLKTNKTYYIFDYQAKTNNDFLDISLFFTPNSMELRKILITMYLDNNTIRYQRYLNNIRSLRR